MVGMPLDLDIVSRVVTMARTRGQCCSESSLENGRRQNARSNEAPSHVPARVSRHVDDDVVLQMHVQNSSPYSISTTSLTELLGPGSCAAAAGGCTHTRFAAEGRAAGGTLWIACPALATPLRPGHLAHLRPGHLAALPLLPAPARTPAEQSPPALPRTQQARARVLVLTCAPRPALSPQSHSA